MSDASQRKTKLLFFHAQQGILCQHPFDYGLSFCVEASELLQIIRIIFYINAINDNMHTFFIPFSVFFNGDNGDIMDSCAC